MAEGFYLSPTPRTQTRKDLRVYCEHFTMSEKKEEPPKTPKTFKTSWGHEYTLMLKEGDKANSLEPTIDDLVEKSRKEKLTNKKK